MGVYCFNVSVSFILCFKGVYFYYIKNVDFYGIVYFLIK